jgi:hypothetical protein
MLSASIEFRARADQPWRPGIVTWSHGTVRLARHENVMEIPTQQLDGVRSNGEIVTLYRTGGLHIDLRGPGELRQIADDILRSARTMREVTRHMRAFGMHRGRPGKDHDAFFEPLLHARREAEAQKTHEAILASFEPRSLEAAMERTLHSMAQTRFPELAPERRALFETLRELANPYWESLARLELAAAKARDEGADFNLRNWRDWLDAVERVFDAADRSWTEIAAVLGG